MFECVINISEGTNLDLLATLKRSCGDSFRDLHHDQFHNRSVFTLINDRSALVDDVKHFISACFAHLQLLHHEGVHPRFGVVDVVPFVPLAPDTIEGAKELRNDVGSWISSTFGVPTFFYDENGPTLPEVRKNAFKDLAPSTGPHTPSVDYGAVAVGARDVLVAWNIWLEHTTLERAKELARQVRTDKVRTLGFPVGDLVQVSCNLVSPLESGPGEVLTSVLSLLQGDEALHHCELVGLAPEQVLRNEDPAQWQRLGLSLEATIEARCAGLINQPERDAQ